MSAEQSNSSMVPTRHDCTTVLWKDLSTFSWKFGNISKREVGFTVKSSKFPDYQSDGPMWCLHATVERYTNKGIIISPQLVYSERKDVLASYILRILSGKKLAREFQPVKFSENTIRDGIILYSPSDYCDAEEYITVECNMRVFLDEPMTLPPQNTPPFPPLPPCRLSEDWGTLLSSGENSDVVLLAGGCEFRVHRLVLTTRSEVFAAMFRYNSQEAQTGRIEVIDFSADTMSQLLRYLYTGELPSAEKHEITDELLAAADKYGLQRLRAECERQLLIRLTVENAAVSLVEMELRQLTATRDCIADFMRRNLPYVIKTEGWKQAVQQCPQVLCQLWPVEKKCEL